MAFTLSSRGQVLGVTELDLVRIGRHWAGWLLPTAEGELVITLLVAARARLATALRTHSADLHAASEHLEAFAFELHRSDGSKVRTVRLTIEDCGPIRPRANPTPPIAELLTTSDDVYFVDDAGCVVAFDDDVDDEYEWRPQDEETVGAVLAMRALERARTFDRPGPWAAPSPAPRHQIYVELVDGEWPRRERRA